MTVYQDEERSSILRVEDGHQLFGHQAQADTAPSNTVVRNPAPDAAPAAAPSSEIFGSFRITR